MNEDLYEKSEEIENIFTKEYSEKIFEYLNEKNIKLNQKEINELNTNLAYHVSLNRDFEL